MKKSAKPISLTLTSPFVLNAFLLGHIERLSRIFSVSVYVNRKESDIPILLAQGARLYHVEIRRNISPWHDLKALCCLWHQYRKNKIAAAVSVTPKGGLLGITAAALAGVPIRIHWFTGQVWASKQGIARWLLKRIDQCMALMATHLLADSASQRAFLIKEGITRANKIQVLGNGSISGVDTKRFQPNEEARTRVRSSLGINQTDFCFIYVGRMKREKGTSDLLEAFSSLSQKHSNIHLLLVGPDEEHLLDDSLPSNIHSVGFTKEVEDYMAAGDVFCLPSYREGFGSVLIEAAAVGLPAVASRIYGITDAVVEGETGLLHQPGNIAELTKCLSDLLNNPLKCRELGTNGSQRANEKFSRESIEDLFSHFLRDCLQKA